MFPAYKRLIKWTAGAILTVLLLFILLYTSIYAGLFGKIPDFEDLTNLKQAQATEITDKNDSLIGKIYVYDRQSIGYRDLPKHLIDALVATEDNRFFEHHGIDNKSLFRVLFKSILLRDRSSGGGSTITLQLAKNLYGRKDYGALSIVINKLKESIVARRIEQIYSKEEILAMYFNTVPFSDNTYGIESASRRFFNTSTKNLSLPEAATLVGTLKASHTYNPRLFPERSQLRRDVVLQQMVKYHYLDEEEAREIMGEKLELDYQYFKYDEGLAPYFREQIKREAESILQNVQKEDGSSYDIYKDGLKISTTIDKELQEIAEASMKEHMGKLQAQFEKAWGKNAPWLKNKEILNGAIKQLPLYKKLRSEGLDESSILDSLSIKNETELFSWKGNDIENVSATDSLLHYLKFLNTGLMSVEPSTGAVRAYIGGINYQYFKYDHVLQSKRQVGSTFKPFVYASAIENGMDPCSYFSVKAVTYENADNWTPSNATEVDNEDENLNYSLKTALSNSINTIAVKVLNEVGIDSVINLAQRMGIKSQLPNVPSLALGTAEIRLAELASAYSAFVNDGTPSSPYYIRKITDRNNQVIYEHKPDTVRQAVISERTREIMLEFMKATVDEGTASRLRNTYHLSNDLAGKTGTTQQNRDGWFVGILPELVTVTWVGNDDPRINFSSTAIGQGANSALPIFALMLQKMNEDSRFDEVTKSRFSVTDPVFLAELDCEPTRKDGFFKRLFGSEDKKQNFGEKKKKKKGFFSFLKKKKDTVR